MAIEHADQLQGRIERAWPTPSEEKARKLVEEWAAFYEGDQAALKALNPGWDVERPYVVDPLAQKLTDAQTNLIYGKDPVVRTADEADQERLQDLVDVNDLPSELPRARNICGSEGEVWWRVKVDRGVADYALIEWHSRKAVEPLLSGRRVIACAFVSEFAVDTDRGAQGTSRTVWRYVEIHTDGLQRNLLYEGHAAGEVATGHVGRSGIGVRRPLEARPETDGLAEEWNHGLPMLAGRIVNRLGQDPKRGVSEYAPLRSLLLSLNEATTIGTENARLTLKRRAVVPESATTIDPLDPTRLRVPTDKDFLVVADGGMDNEKAPPFRVLEYSFDAEALIAYIGSLTDTILTRASVAPQLVGRHTEQAQSGAALRARLIDSVLAAESKARAWDDAVPKLLALAQRVDALPETEGGLGRDAGGRDARLPLDHEGAAGHAAAATDRLRHARDGGLERDGHQLLLRSRAPGDPAHPALRARRLRTAAPPRGPCRGPRRRWLIPNSRMSDDAPASEIPEARSRCWSGPSLWEDDDAAPDRGSRDRDCGLDPQSPAAT